MCISTLFFPLSLHLFHLHFSSDMRFIDQPSHELSEGILDRLDLQLTRLQQKLHRGLNSSEIPGDFSEYSWGFWRGSLRGSQGFLGILGILEGSWGFLKILTYLLWDSLDFVREFWLFQGILFCDYVLNNTYFQIYPLKFWRRVWDTLLQKLRSPLRM